MTSTTNELEGLLLVDKPAGITSHDVVRRTRRAVGCRRIGHTGTLDPFATGLLILCVGPATRLVEYFHVLPKSYCATVRLGVETDTDDHTGEPLVSSETWRSVSREDLERALVDQRGSIRQRPPAYSAIKVGGVRAHKAARAGAPLELEPRSVRVLELDTVAFRPPDVVVSVSVSSGTYIRSIARDLGRALGCGAHLSALRRMAIGPFGVEAAVEPPPPDGSWPETPPFLTPAEALTWLPCRELTAVEEADVVAGRRISGAGVTRPTPEPEYGDEPPLPVALRRAGRLVAVAEAVDDELQPRKVFPWTSGEMES